ncbi:UNVERIFIED_CONTAM: hypothetical protein Slati_2510200 [Sesamum latifolium]|uniref:Uncharacterized protein n=1 Tax=Sesamum latifolium TaxID=2727402 RepID=A0AAW2WF66_9LAMI
MKLTSSAASALIDPEPYRRLVGRLLYSSFTKLDVSYGTQRFSQFVHRPCRVHMDATLHLVRYLKECSQKGLFFPSSNPLNVTAYCNVDWANYVDPRRSLTDYCIFLRTFIYLDDKDTTNCCKVHCRG